ncbi:hypothetical protein QUB33_25990, partial [Microcoleus sp. B3-A4]
ELDKRFWKHRTDGTLIISPVSQHFGSFISWITPKGRLKSWAELGVGSTFRYTGANDNARVLNYLTRFSCTLTTQLLLAHPIPVTFSPFFSKP